MPAASVRAPSFTCTLTKRHLPFRFPIDARVSSGTYIRAIADVLGGHCRTLRRTEVGPFSVEEADEERVLALEETLPRLAGVR